MSQTVAYSGYLGTATVNGVDMAVTGWSCDAEMGSFETSSTADGGWTSMGWALKSLSGSFDFFFDTSKDPFAGTPNMYARQVVPLVLTATSGATFAGNAFIEKLSFKSEVKDGVKVTASFKSTGSWTTLP